MWLMVSWGRQRGLIKEHEVALWVIDKFIIMRIVLVPWVYTYLKAYQFVHLKYYVQSIIAWQFYLNKAVQEIVAHKNLISIHFRKLDDLATLYWLYYISLPWQQKWLHPWSTGSPSTQSPFFCQCSNGLEMNSAVNLQ